MSPWSLYTNQPQLMQAVVVAGASALVLRSPVGRRGPAFNVALAGLAWAGAGVADYAVYAFFTLSAQEIESTQLIIEWLRVPIVLVGAFFLFVHLSSVER